MQTPLRQGRIDRLEGPSIVQALHFVNPHPLDTSLPCVVPYPLGSGEWG